LNIKGGLKSCTNFITELENIPYSIDFTTVKMTSYRDEKNNVVWSVNIGLKAITN